MTRTPGAITVKPPGAWKSMPPTPIWVRLAGAGERHAAGDGLVERAHDGLGLVAVDVQRDGRADGVREGCPTRRAGGAGDGLGLAAGDVPGLAPGDGLGVARVDGARLARLDGLRRRPLDRLGEVAVDRGGLVGVVRLGEVAHHVLVLRAVHRDVALAAGVHEPVAVGGEGDVVAPLGEQQVARI